jgi:hypothetical protein
MPRKITTRRPAVGHRRMKGRGKILEWIKGAIPKVDGWLKKTQLLSKLGNFASSTGLVPAQYQGLLTGATSGLQKLGYGRRMGRGKRMYCGRGIRLAGGALRLAGARDW